MNNQGHQADDSLTITDNRTGRRYIIAIDRGAICAADLLQITTGPDDPGLLSYDPGGRNTASCRSSITFVEGQTGILEYRGYAIEELIARSTYVEVAYLLVYGTFPRPAQLREWRRAMASHAFVRANTDELVKGFSRTAHPMVMLQALVAALASDYPPSDAEDQRIRRVRITRAIAKMPTLAALAYRHNRAMAYVHPDRELSYAGNLLAMLHGTPGVPYRPDLRLAPALDALLILQADHAMSASTSTVRSLGSARSDLYPAIAAGIGTLWGPLQGGATGAALGMLRDIATIANVSGFIADMKHGRKRLFGFGHPAYQTHDPRARLAKVVAEQVFEVTGTNPLLAVALEIERIVLADEYFVQRRLYPSLELYTGLIYEAMGIPPEMFAVMVAIARTSGWAAHWLETIEDPKRQPVRPRQIYTGKHWLGYVPIDQR